MIKRIILSLCLMTSLITVNVTPAKAISLVTKTTLDSASTTEKVAATSALDEFKSLSKKERRSRIVEAKKAIKDFKKNRATDASTNTLLLVILAILLPPLAVYLKEGQINSKFWISLLLTLLFFLPGVIYALFVVLGNA